MVVLEANAENRKSAGLRRMQTHGPDGCKIQDEGWQSTSKEMTNEMDVKSSAHIAKQTEEAEKLVWREI